MFVIETRGNDSQSEKRSELCFSKITGYFHNQAASKLRQEATTLYDRPN